MRFPALPAALAGIVLAASVAGCGAAADGGSDRPSVVTSFYPLQYVAQRIVGDHATVATLTRPGQEPHDLELKIPQTAEVSDADLVLYAKGFQAAVDQAIEQTDPGSVVDATATAPAEGDDPHFWLDPLRLAAVATAFAEKMTTVDPDHAADFATRLSELEHDLAELDRAYRDGLRDCAITTTVVSHDAFGYLSKYDLEFVAINGLSPEAEPSPAHIRELHDLIETDAITTVFSESLASPEMAQTLAGDLGITTAVLDPIEGLSDDTADEDYLSLMSQNLQALREANQCR